MRERFRFFYASVNGTIEWCYCSGSFGCAQEILLPLTFWGILGWTMVSSSKNVQTILAYAIHKLKILRLSADLGGISSSILSVIFTDKFALSQSDARISVAYKIRQWKSLTKCLMKCPPGLYRGEFLKGVLVLNYDHVVTLLCEHSHCTRRSVHKFCNDAKFPPTCTCTYMCKLFSGEKS